MRCTAFTSAPEAHVDGIPLLTSKAALRKRNRFRQSLKDTDDLPGPSPPTWGRLKPARIPPLRAGCIVLLKVIASFRHGRLAILFYKHRVNELTLSRNGVLNMIELDRDLCVQVTIVEWQTAGDKRTELEPRPLAEAAFDAYQTAFNEAYHLELEKILAQLTTEGVDPIMAKTEAELLAFERAGQVAKSAACDALDDPEVRTEV